MKDYVSAVINKNLIDTLKQDVNKALTEAIQVIDLTPEMIRERNVSKKILKPIIKELIPEQEIQEEPSLYQKIITQITKRLDYNPCTQTTRVNSKVFNQSWNKIVKQYSPKVIITHHSLFLDNDFVKEQVLFFTVFDIKGFYHNEVHYQIETLINDDQYQFNISINYS